MVESAGIPNGLSGKVGYNIFGETPQNAPFKRHLPNSNLKAFVKPASIFQVREGRAVISGCKSEVQGEARCNM